MGKIFRNLIEYNGIDECTYESIVNFKQINIDYSFDIPIEKPDIENIVRVNVDYNIESKEIVKTPIGISFEGQESTGFKLLIIGDIRLRIEYCAKNLTQSIHTVHTTFPFCGYVTLPKDFNPTSVVFPVISVEDVYSVVMNPRCIYNNVSLILIADLC